MDPPSLSTSDSEPDAYSSDANEFAEASPRKRRRLSHSPSNSEDEKPRKIFHTTSRIKSRTNPPTTQSTVQLKETEINNGKVVDKTSSFATLGVSPQLIVSLSQLAIYRPTAIQKGVIPEILKGRDVVGGVLLS